MSFTTKMEISSAMGTSLNLSGQPNLQMGKYQLPSVSRKQSVVTSASCGSSLLFQSWSPETNRTRMESGVERVEGRTRRSSACCACPPELGLRCTPARVGVARCRVGDSIQPNQALQQTGAARALSGVHCRSAAPAAELGRSAADSSFNRHRVGRRRRTSMDVRIVVGEREPIGLAPRRFEQLLERR